jgi:hypothetical protein
MTVSMCPHILFNRRQPMAGFIDHDGNPIYYCAVCLPARVEDALREGMTAQEVADAISFTNCGHIEDNTGTCGRCAKGITAMLLYLSTTLHLKGKHELLTRLDRVITDLIGKHGRLTPDGIYTCHHGKAL